MYIKDIIVYKGRNIYCHKPVIKLLIDLEQYANVSSVDIDGFNDRLINLLPGLKNHTCGLGYEGGFIERLKEGTYPAHILEHIIIELQAMLGHEIKYGKTRLLKEPSLYYIIYEYKCSICAVESGVYGFKIINALINNEDINISEIVNSLKGLNEQAAMGPSTSAIVKEAKKRGIPVTLLDNNGLIQLGYGRYKRLIECTITDATSCITTDIATNKEYTKIILDENAIPVPYGKVVYSEGSAILAAEQLGMPVVIKPYNGNQGKGVRLRINSIEEVKAAYKETTSYSNAAIVEKFIQGRDYRVLVVDGKVSAVSERIPPFVIGDGISSIAGLVEIENKNPNRGVGHEKPLTKIRLDAIALNILAKNGFSQESIPNNGERVLLRENGNLSTGGIAIDCTDIIHPQNSEIAIKAAKQIGLDIAGIDFVAQDISRPIKETGGAIVEVNAAPGLRMHIYPYEGKSRDVGKDIMDMLYPANKPYSIPIVAVTGTNGKTTTVRLIAHVLKSEGKRVGLTTTSGIFVDDECILKGDNTGSISAKQILSRPIDAAVLETARGGIISGGLAYDLADVGVITNIADDHLGQDGINTIDDLAYVKALVAEAVKPSGYAVLNYNDKKTSWILERLKSGVILFSNGKPQMEPNYNYVYNHEGMIYINQIPFLKAEDIPITYGGIVQFNIENAMAAIAALYGLRIGLEAIAKGIKSFMPNSINNPGRLNIFNVCNYKVMLDYGHNRAGYEAVIHAIKGMEHKRLIGVIGMPGDRSDNSIAEVARMCAKVFNRIYIKEDIDLRGRKNGEVADILNTAIVKEGMKPQDVNIILEEKKALLTAMQNALEGDLIVVFYEKYQPLLELISQYKGNMQYAFVK